MILKKLSTSADRNKKRSVSIFKKKFNLIKKRSKSVDRNKKRSVSIFKKNIKLIKKLEKKENEYSELLDYFGICDIGTLLTRDEVDNNFKSLGYNENIIEAKYCFIQQPSTCPANTCIATANSCVPNKNRVNWWIPEISKLNSSRDGKVWDLIDGINVSKYIKFASSTIHMYVSVLKNKDRIIINFPIGMVINIPKNMLIDIKIIIDKYLDNNKYNTVILCGHSCGSVFAQQVAYSYIGHKNIKKIYVCGSGSYKWTTETQKTEILNAFNNRWYFIAMAIQIEKNILVIDSFIFRETNINSVFLPMILVNETQVLDIDFNLTLSNETKFDDKKITFNDIVTYKGFEIEPNINLHQLSEYKKFFFNFFSI